MLLHSRKEARFLPVHWTLRSNSVIRGEAWKLSSAMQESCLNSALNLLLSHCSESRYTSLIQTFLFLVRLQHFQASSV